MGDPLLQTVLLIAGGVLAGMASGMGIGGGALLIPIIILVAQPEQHVVQAVNLIFFIPAAIAALCIHIKNRMIDVKVLLPIIISGLAGAFAGSSAANLLPGALLRKMFGVFLLLMGFYEVIRRDRPSVVKDCKDIKRS